MAIRSASRRWRRSRAVGAEVDVEGVMIAHRTPRTVRSHAVIAEMNVVAKPYYQRVKEAVEVRPSGVPRRSDQELDEILRSPTALVNTTIGFGALVVILWLMIFNPGV